MTTVDISPEQLAALEAARAMARTGIPVFVAPADAANATGFALPRNWQNVTADPAVVDQWRPGMALAAVMGQGLDVVDIDPRNGGDPAALNGRTPVSYGVAFTPSGGVHSFIRSLGVRKKTNLLPGIDLQAGAPDGSGRGFVFLAPTVRVSKVTGTPEPYRWGMPLDLPRLIATGAGDLSGLALAELVRAATPAPGSPSADEFMKVGPWANTEATLADGRNNGVAKLAASLRGRGGWREDDAIRYMTAEVWPLVDQTQGGHEFTLDEFEATIKAQFRQYPDGGAQRQAEAAIPPTPLQPPSTLRYFGEKNVFLAATLAEDVRSLGPLANGIDDRMWVYHGGVWRSAKHIVRDRVTFLLGERYRPGHTRNVEDIVRGQVPTIASEPIPDIVNVRNGLLDWRTGQLHPHSPDVLSTVQLNVEYDPAAQCPAFERFVEQVVPADVVDTVWELVGYLMYSGNPLHKAVMLTGTGRNGKGTFLRVMVTLLGRQNVTTASLHDLVNTRFTTASLFGKLANIAGDIDAGYLENTAVLKGITGGDMISAEHKGTDRFDFSPWAVPVFSANRVPASADTTIGYLSRWLIVNFPNDFSGRENRALDTALQTQSELNGIAVRGLKALPRLLARGDFEMTQSAHEAREDFVRRVDQVRTWIFDCAEMHPALPWVGRTELYQAYQRWTARDGHRPVKASEFYDRLESAGAVPAVVHGGRGFKGIRVIDNGFGPGWGAAGAPITTPDTSVPVPAPSAPESTPSTLGLVSDLAPVTTRGAGSGGEPAPSSSPVNVGTPASLGAEGAATDLSPLTPARTPTHTGRGMASSCTPAPKIISGGAVSAGIVAKLLADRPAPVTGQLPAGGIVCGGSPTAADIEAVNAFAAQLAAEPKPKRTKIDPAERAAAKAAEKAAALEQAIAAASGELVELPALVTRDGAVRPIALVDVGDVVAAFGMLAELTIDVETTGYPIGHADYALRTIQLGNDVASLVFDADDHDQAAVAGKMITDAAALHAHSATADLVPLAVAGRVDLDGAWPRMFDTVIPAKLADPQSTGSDPGLKQLAGAMLREQATAPAADEARAALFKAGRWLTDTKPTTPLQRSGWAQVDRRCTTMVRYAASDVLDAAALAKRLPAVPPHVLARERTAQRLTARVAHEGVRLDGEHVARKLPEHRAELQAAAERLAQFGIDNPGSDQQVGAKLIELGAPLPRTKTGRPSVAKGGIEPFAKLDGPIGDLVRARLDYQHHETVLGLFLEPYSQLVTRGDGRARPTIYTLGADTGRMSCVQSDALIEMPRDLAKYPNGVPITEVNAGDWVYAFDHQRELVLRRVKWCAQTGVRQTMIITAENSDGHQLTLRATPEHLIRLRNGDWRATENLMHATGRPHRDDGPRLMTMVKRIVDDGYVKFFPHSIARLGAGTTGGGKNREHRWVLEQIAGRKISTKVDVNHIDGNRANNHPSNLQELPMHEHRGNRDLAWGVAQAELALSNGPNDYRVVSVTPGPIEPVWDMEVEDVHNFVANGICVHNCVRPNLQQVPRQGGMRACVTADPGDLIVSADFAGVEVRVACALSGDATLKHMIDNGIDLHWEIARQVYGPDATKEDRYNTKRGVFGRLYGSGIPGIARTLGITEQAAAATVDTLDAMTPQLAQWTASLKRAVQNGLTSYESYSGRVIHLDPRLPHKALNYCVQGTARELLVDTLVRWDDTRWSNRVLMPVHDEVLVFVPEAEAADATAALVAAMETELFGVRIAAESSEPSFAWSDAS